MAQIGIQVDQTNTEVFQGFQPLPTGWYLAIIIDSDVGPTKNQTGMMLKLQYQIIDGQFKGRQIFANINLQNQNVQAQQIGQSQLLKVSLCCGFEKSPPESSMLHNKVHYIRVTAKNDDRNPGEIKNEIKDWKASELPASAVGGHAAAQPAMAPAGATAAQAALAQPAAAPAGVAPIQPVSYNTVQQQTQAVVRGQEPAQVVMGADGKPVWARGA